MATYGKPQSTVLDRTVQTGHVAIGEARKHFHRTTMCAMALSRYSLRWIIFRPFDQQHEYQHRHQEWLDFLKKISRETPKHLQLHSIVDNYTTHKYHQVKAWLEKHERFHMHFTPTSRSWMNMIERFFKPLRTNLRFQTLLHAYLRHRAWSRGGCYHCEK